MNTFKNLFRATIVRQTKTDIWDAEHPWKWHICEAFTVFLKRAVSCWSFRKNYFLTVCTKGRAGAADDCRTHCLYQRGIFCHCQHLAQEVWLVVLLHPQRAHANVLMSSPSWMQLLVWLLSPQRCELLPLLKSWVGLGVWVTTWSLHYPRNQKYSCLLPPGCNWGCGSQHGPLCALTGQGAALAVGIVGSVGGRCESPPGLLPPTRHRGAHTFLE